MDVPLPRFSVIVPAYKVQAYLHACLESVLSPVVSGSGADRGRRRLAGRLRRDHRRVRGPRPAGAAPSTCRGTRAWARPATPGLARGHRRLPGLPGRRRHPHPARAARDRRPAEGDRRAGRPGLRLRAHRTGRARPSATRPPSSSPSSGPAPFRLEDRPGLLRLLTVVWNKAYRREFVEREGLTFPPGYYEDTPWTYPVLHDGRVDRDPRPGLRALPAAPAGQHHPHHQPPPLRPLRPVRPGLRVRRRSAPNSRAGGPCCSAAWSTTSARSSPIRDRLPRGSRGRRSCAGPAPTAAATAPPGHPVPLRSRLRHTLVRLGLHRTYRALRTGIGACAAGPARPPSVCRGPCARRPSGCTTGVQRRLPLRADRAVFAAYGGRGHGCNPGALEAAFRTYAPHIRTAWIARPEHHHTIPTATRRLRPGTAAYWTALARSTYLVNNTGFDRRLVKRPGQVLLQTQHGTPLKHMGLDLQDRPAAARGTDFAELLRGRRQVGPRPVRQPALHPDLGAGLPRPLHARSNTASPATTSSSGRPPRTCPRLRESLGIPEGSVAILYAPTHRDYRRTQHTALDLERVLRQLGPRFVVLTRAHHRLRRARSPPRLAPDHRRHRPPERRGSSASPRTPWSPTTRH